ncbi:MAG TPA: histidine kinase [Flavisolibacter sp.]|nr:histidine kinase [Flavisolibacter sp.]
MANPLLSAPALLKENISFLVAGTFLSAVSILLFDDRLYTSREVLAVFTGLFLLFLVQAFAGTSRKMISVSNALVLYLQSFIITVIILALLYGFVLPYPFQTFLTFRLCLLVTFIETSLHFFIRYKKQYGLTLEKESRISQTVKQQEVKELEVLKQQIDPHFIFNSFNTLNFLIEENSVKARQFCNKLANVYRYIIFNSNKNLVALSDELGFAKDYAYLQEIRHSNEVEIRFSVPLENDGFFILPVSIQLLIENAIKHNEFSERDPLRITITFEGNAFSVENNTHAKNYTIPSSKIGLANLRDRCRLILGKDLELIKSEASFKVILPVLQK